MLENIHTMVCKSKAMCGIEVWGLKHGKNYIRFTVDFARTQWVYWIAQIELGRDNGETSAKGRP